MQFLHQLFIRGESEGENDFAALHQILLSVFVRHNEPLVGDFLGRGKGNDLQLVAGYPGHEEVETMDGLHVCPGPISGQVLVSTAADQRDVLFLLAQHDNEIHSRQTGSNDNGAVSHILYLAAENVNSLHRLFFPRNVRQYRSGPCGHYNRIGFEFLHFSGGGLFVQFYFDPRLVQALFTVLLRPQVLALGRSRCREMQCSSKNTRLLPKCHIMPSFFGRRGSPHAGRPSAYDEYFLGFGSGSDFHQLFPPPNERIDGAATMQIRKDMAADAANIAADAAVDLVFTPFKGLGRPVGVSPQSAAYTHKIGPAVSHYLVGEGRGADIAHADHRDVHRTLDGFRLVDPPSFWKSLDVQQHLHAFIDPA